MQILNRRMILLGVAVVALVAIACGTDEPGSGPTAGPEGTPTVGPVSTPIAPASDITRALGEARVRWDSLGLVDYEFRTNLVCFCPQEFNAQVDLSVRMLEYLFRQTLDMSPAAYYRRLRLQTARRMVVDTRLQLQEIAIRTGFNSLSSFSRRFKNYYQQTPGDCRRQARAG